MEKFSVFALLVLGPQTPALAQGQGSEPVVLSWGFAGLLFGVAVLLVAIGALVVLLRLARLIERLEDYFKRK